MGSTFQVDGLISGLNTTEIVAQLMSLERKPITSLQAKQTTIQKQVDAFKEIGTRLTSLKASLAKLTQPSVLGAKTATTDTLAGSPAVVTATAGPSAAIGSFRVTVRQLATSTVTASGASIGQAVDGAARLAEAGFGESPTTGFFTVNGATITVDADTSLDGLSGSNSVVARINESGAGVTASVENNRLVLRSTSAIQLGSAADTSNFLNAAKVLASPQAQVGGQYTVTSLGNLGVTQTGVSLDLARLATPLSASTGKFQINGVEIAYDAQSDSLNRIISRINASTAGVTASYDSQADRLILTSKATGSITTSLADVEGNLLAATGLTAANAQTLGQNAEYSVDTANGGASLYSTSNTVSGIVPGVSLSLKSVSLTPVTVTIDQETATAVQAVKDFVEQYNSIQSLLNNQTTYDATTKTAGLFLGDGTVRSVQSRMRNLLFDRVLNDGKLNSLTAIGITTGALGSGVGSTGALVLDEAKFTQALKTDPTSVARLFAPAEPTVALQTGGTGSISAALISPSGTPRAGRYDITSDASGNLSVVFTPVGGNAEDAVTGTIAAGGANSTLLRGLTLRAGDTLRAGTDVVVVSPGDGIATRLGTYLDSLVGSKGAITTRRTSGEGALSRLARQIADKEDQLEDKETRLLAKYAALESTLSRFQSLSSQLSSWIAGLSSSGS